MKLILVVLFQLLFLGHVQGKGGYLVEVAGNRSLHETHHGNKTKQYLVEVPGNSSLPKQHLGNKGSKGSRDKKRERKGRGNKKIERKNGIQVKRGKKNDYQDPGEIAEHENEADFKEEDEEEDEEDEEDDDYEVELLNSKDGDQTPKSFPTIPTPTPTHSPTPSGDMTTHEPEYPGLDEDTKHGCSKKKKRRNVNSLNVEEKGRLVSALQRLIESGRFLDLGNVHGAPLHQICPNSPNGMCCIHNQEVELFLPWHRLYMAQMEEELGEALPFWDWTVDKDVPDLWEEIKAPMKPPVTSICEKKEDWPVPIDKFDKNACISNSNGGKSFVTRNQNHQMNKDWGKLRESVRDALRRTDDKVRCDMGCLQTAGYDPVFYLHHTFLDYLWAYWQVPRCCATFLCCLAGEIYIQMINIVGQLFLLAGKAERR